MLNESILAWSVAGLGLLSAISWVLGALTSDKPKPILQYGLPTDLLSFQSVQKTKRAAMFNLIAALLALLAITCQIVLNLVSL